MNKFSTLCNNILHESLVRSISTGYYLCTNAENLGLILNVVNRYHGTRTLDGGLIELFYNVAGENIDAVKLIGSLFEYGYLKKHEYGSPIGHKAFRTSIYSQQQLNKIIPGLQHKSYSERHKQN